LGVAFQLRDDVLGVFGDPKTLGKPVGNDLRQGKETALVEEARREPRAVALLGKVLGRADASDGDLRELVTSMETCGVRARVDARIRALLAEAREGLVASQLSEGPALQALFGAIGALGERSA